MKKNAVLTVLILIAVLLVCFGLRFFLRPVAAAPEVQLPEETAAVPLPEKTPAPTPEPVRETAVPEATPYVSPIDFEALQEQNPDAYAWIRIEGTTVDYPVFQSQTDDTYYLAYDIDGNYSNAGSLFTEHLYNDLTFEDQITVIYGHRMLSGNMFGCLQPTYSGLEALREYSEIVIYRPERELHYRVFAAVTYDNRHILYHYGDGTERSTQLFLNSLGESRGLSMILDEENMAGSTDKLLVLSTCLYGSHDKRFLVVGKLTEEPS